MNLVANIAKSFVRPFDRLPLRGVGAEIGVYKGDHAASLLRRHSSVEKLFCVDPYRNYDQSQCDELEFAEQVAHAQLSPFNGRAVRLRMAGNTAALAALPELDFAYIDGDHRYASVKRDIESVWPRIKAGGIMGGHDFHHTWPDVIRAVTEFTVSNNLVLCVETPDWWIVKL